MPRTHDLPRAASPARIVNLSASTTAPWTEAAVMASRSARAADASRSQSAARALRATDSVAFIGDSSATRCQACRAAASIPEPKASSAIGALRRCESDGLGTVRNQPLDLGDQITAGSPRIAPMLTATAARLTRSDASSILAQDGLELGKRPRPLSQPDRARDAVHQQDDRLAPVPDPLREGEAAAGDLQTPSRVAQGVDARGVDAASGSRSDEIRVTLRVLRPRPLRPAPRSVGRGIRAQSLS